MFDSPSGAWYNRRALTLEHPCVVANEYGGMAEWFKAAVLKTAVAHWVTGGSNPSPSALTVSGSSGEMPEWTIGAAC